MTTATDLDRRSLLRLGGGAALALGLPALPRPALSTELHSEATALVLLDRRYRASAFFAAGFEGPGVEVLAVGRDLARLWQRDIAIRLARRPLLIEAVTLPADLFGIERLADGSGAVLEARLDIIDGRPRRGRPKHLVYWRMRFGPPPDAAIG